MCYNARATEHQCKTQSWRQVRSGRWRVLHNTSQDRRCNGSTDKHDRCTRAVLARRRPGVGEAEPLRCTWQSGRRMAGLAGPSLVKRKVRDGRLAISRDHFNGAGIIILPQLNQNSYLGFREPEAIRKIR